MTERPINRNAKQVSAILDGATQMRLPMNPQPEYMLDPIPCEWYTPTVIRGGEEVPGKDIYGTYNDDYGWKSPFGAPGDLLWVREKARGQSIGPGPALSLVYAADDHLAAFTGELGGLAPYKLSGWTPSIHMPKWACRTRLLVKRVWVERVNSISGEDAIAEGWPRHTELFASLNTTDKAKRWFRNKWDSNYAVKYPWSGNPFDWCCEFEVKGASQ